jgi:recombination protein RecT
MADQKRDSAVKPIGALLVQYKAQIAQALPKHLTTERLLRIANNAIQNGSGLRDCSPISLLSCVVECGQLGLEPDSVLGEVYLVPFKGTATVIVGYKGFQKLIYQSGEIFNIEAHVVRKADEFSYSFGSRPHLDHKPTGNYGDEKNTDDWIGAYAIAQFRDGNSSFDYLTRAEVLKRKNRSAAVRAGKKDSPWFTDEEAMWKKSAIRAIAGKLPKSTTDFRLARATALDTMTEAGLMTPTATGFEMATEADRLLSSGDDPANGGDLTEAREMKEETKKPATVPKANIPKGDVIDVKPEKKKEPAKSDPIVKNTTEIYNRGTSNGWRIDDIPVWIKKEFGVGMKEIRESMLPRIMKVMEGGT